MRDLNIKINSHYFDSKMEIIDWPIFEVKPNDNFYLNDFGSKGSYFCIYTSKKIAEEPIFNYPLSNGNISYLLIQVQSLEQNSLTFFYLGININWLKSELGINVLDSEKSVNKVIKNWQTSKFILSKHHLFVQKLSQNNHRSILISNYFFEFLYLFLNELRFPNQEHTNSNELELQKIRDIEVEVSHNLHLSIPTIEIMAKGVGMSSSKFKILFRNIFGQSVKQHFLTKKQDYAQSLLREKQYTLTQIAHKLGYNYTSGLTRILSKNALNHGNEGNF